MAGEVSKFIHYVQDESGNKYGINASKLDGLTKETLEERLAALTTISENLATALNVESLRAQTKEAELKTDLETEINRAQTAEQNLADTKQDKLTAGANITITADNVISVTGDLSTAEWGKIYGNISEQSDLQNELNNKQNTIADLDTIRSKANTAVQPSALDDYAKKTDIPEVPTKVSAFENDSGYLTEHQSLEAYRTAEEQDVIDGTKADTTYVNSNFVPNSSKSDVVYVKNAKGENTGVPYGQTTTGNTIMWRDANGRSRVQTPTESTHIANKGYVDTEVAKKQNKLTAGANITIDENNVISASGQLASTAWGQITGTLTDQTDLVGALNAKQSIIEDLEAIRSGAEKGTTAVQPSELNDYAKTADLADIALSGSYNDLKDKPEIPSLEGYATEAWVESKNYLTEHQSLAEYAKTADVDAKIAALPKVTFEKVDSLPDPAAEYVFATSHKIYLVQKKASEKDNYNEYICLDGGEEQEPRYYWELIGSTAVDLSNYYTKTDVDNKLAEKVDKINGKQLSTEDYTSEDKAKLSELENYDDSEIKADLSEIGENLNDHISDTDIHVTTDEKATWNAKSDFSGSYNDLSDKPNIPEKTSDLTNDSGFITSDDIPTKVSAFDNDAGYLTTHQDISYLATKEEVQAVEDKIPSIDGLATEEYVDTEVAKKSAVSVTSTGTSTNEVNYITIDDTEYKLAGSGSGGSYTPGDGIDISDTNEISVDDTVAKKADFSDIITIDVNTNTLKINY